MLNSAAGFGHEDKVAFNRRLRMKNGLTFSHPGAGNPDILGYAGPIDPQVGTVGIWDLKGNLLGVVVNFSCHATTNPGGISANWIWSMETNAARRDGQWRVARGLHAGCVRRRDASGQPHEVSKSQRRGMVRARRRAGGRGGLQNTVAHPPGCEQ